MDLFLIDETLVSFLSYHSHFETIMFQSEDNIDQLNALGKDDSPIRSVEFLNRRLVQLP
jgi:hypothetical protein